MSFHHYIYEKKKKDPESRRITSYPGIRNLSRILTETWTLWHCNQIPQSSPLAEKCCWEIKPHLQPWVDFSFRDHQHTLPRQNNKLITVCWQTSLKSYTALCDPQWAFYSRAVITETPTYSSTGSAAGTNWNSLPSKQQPENKFDETQLIAGSLVLN